MSHGCQLAWLERMLRSLGRWLTAYADDVQDYSMHDYAGPAHCFIIPAEYKGKVYKVGANYIVIARRVD